MSVEKVTGSECLNYINRKIGFCSHDYNMYGNQPLTQPTQLNGSTPTVIKDLTTCVGTFHQYLRTTIMRWSHDTSKRKIGVVLGRSFEGGYEVALLGNERIAQIGKSGDYGGMEYVNVTFNFGNFVDYTMYPLEDNKCVRDFLPSTIPMINQSGVTVRPQQTPQYSLGVQASEGNIGFDESMNFNPIDHITHKNFVNEFGIIWQYAGQLTTSDWFDLTDDISNTMVFGVRDKRFSTYPLYYMDDPLKVCSGNLYQLACDLAFKTQPYFPGEFANETMLSMYEAEYNTVDVDQNLGVNMTAIPYNIILTNDVNQAKKYLRDGTLPSDAFLFPLDFDNLPQYQSDDTDDSDEDDGGDDDVDDNGRDTDENLPEVPPYTPGSLNNNNVYLLTAGELNDIIDWLWNDVGDVQDIGDLVTKIQGLTSDLIQ
jgi:hypothetical protein